MTPFPPEATELLVGWYQQNRRDLPWRASRDPYRVLVSEIMLQQTRAETVKPYFYRFLEALPTVEALAACDEATLLKLWEGLGYYSRVRNLQKAARAVVEQHGGAIPSDFDALLALPGVGRYTAGAVASIAYDVPVPAVDGNVLRVLARLLGDDTDVLSATAKTNAERTLAPHVPTEGAGDFTQSLIELGALICTPGEHPKCEDCPLRLLCVAEREGRQGELPVRLTKTKRRVERRTVLVIRDGDTVALRRRPAGGLLGGLYEFPCLPEWVDEEGVRAYLAELGVAVGEITSLGNACHLFSHIEWQMQGFAVELTSTDGEQVSPSDWVWASEPELEQVYPLPSAYAAYRAACFEDKKA
jgi:A/G-specific adenine glycosylase